VSSRRVSLLGLGDDDSPNSRKHINASGAAAMAASPSRGVDTPRSAASPMQFFGAHVDSPASTSRF